jgi:hypothetical protein
VAIQAVRWEGRWAIGQETEVEAMTWRYAGEASAGRQACRREEVKQTGKQAL